MKKLYLSAPLPFVGQKRMFAREFIKVLEQFKDKTVFVDLFGGSGLLSHITKHQRPDATVVYNDFDGYRRRLEAIPQTNALLADLRAIAKDIQHHKPITGAARERILERIIREERQTGYVDFITISSSLMFSMKYQLSVEGMKKETLYNNIRKADYQLCPDYLDGLTITSCDYKELYLRYKDVPDAVFLVDPPYLSTDVCTYKMYWSSIVELCQWMGKNRTLGDPFEGCVKSEFNAHMNYNAGYTDMMLYKRNDGPCTKSAA